MEENTKFLALFWDLASTEPKVSKKAAITLIRSLDFCQKRFEEGGESGHCQELTYSLKRLVRGLGSSRDGARVGFSVALTEV